MTHLSTLQRRLANSAFGILGLLLLAFALSAGTAKGQSLANITKTQFLTDSIISVLKTQYRISPTPLPNIPLCRDDGFCTFEFGDYNVRVYGAGIVEVDTYLDVPAREYVDFCSAIFSGVSEVELPTARDAISAIFAQAQIAGRAKVEFAGTEISVAPDFYNRLACRYFRF